MPEAKVLGVVKADAYGHGAVQAATVLRDAGADFFAVATIGEGVELREAGFTLPILVLGYVGDADAALLAEYDIAAALCDTDTAKAFSAAAQAAGKPIRVHIALNTGMTRIGFETRSTKENVQEILQAISLPGLEAEGAFTHFAVADVNGGEEFRYVSGAGKARCQSHVPPLFQQCRYFAAHTDLYNGFVSGRRV